MKKSILYGLLFSVFILFIFCSVKFSEYLFIKTHINSNKENMSKFYTNKAQCKNGGDIYIAHGGGVGEFVYTNSLEAVNDSLKKSFNFIEIDMIKTTDNVIIGGHHWSHLKSLLSLNDKTENPLSLREIENLKIKQKYNILTSSKISEVMKNNEDFILVTDKITDYDLLLKQIPYPDRMIVEVFSIKQYKEALLAGVKYPAYCIGKEKHLNIAKIYKFPIVTLSPSLMKTPEGIQAVQELHKKGVTILFFRVGHKEFDTTNFLNEHIGKTFSKIYTDIWSPNNPHYKTENL